ncbi:MAG: hypothetical protein EA382_02180 [Spirochaetaceae bacterium]|nr:MAG: hypothetical protein EA382_02180 [Spirochaetaceae bacterium]
MTVYVLTDDERVRPIFATVERSRTYSVEWHPASDRPVELKRFNAHESFLYFDASGMDASAVRRCVNVLEDVRPCRFGVIDLAGSVDDVAELFHRRAADYIGPAIAAHGVSTARMRRVVEYGIGQGEDSDLDRLEPTIVDTEPDAEPYPDASGPDWSRVRPGAEYTFLMLYAGIDRIGDLSRKSSAGLLADLRRRFVSILEEYFGPYGSRMWTWKEDYGLMLLPFDGESVDACLPAIRLMINRVLINTEQLSPYGEIGWRLALHLGRTVYRANGDTGSIVAADVNFLFHLGSRYLEPGTLSVTQPVHGLLPARIRPLMNHRGSFESVQVYQLRDLA